ncbi:MAG: TAXI family TRAP transporter solute-binding subunit [Gemmatimonas sp.]
MTSGVSRVAALAAVAAFLCAGTARADFNDNKPITYTVDGATASGYFKVVTEAINGVIRDAYPGSAATYKPGSPAGGIQNISTGQADFSFTGGAPEIAYALEGKAPFKESLKGKFKFVGLLHNDLVVYNLATKEWADKNGIKSFADIASKKPQMRLAVNQLANLQSTLSMSVAIFDAYGINEADITGRGGSLFRGNTSSNVDAMRDGKVDVMINGGFVPQAEFTDLARGRELIWISGDPAKMKAAADRWGYSVYTVKKDAYPFLTKDETTLVLWSAVVAGSHVSDETVYKFMKALLDSRDRVRSIHPSLANFSLENFGRNPTPLPYHPGAERLYKERGLLK